MRTFMRAAALILPLGLCAFFYAPSVSYAETGLSIQPVKVDETIRPGETLESTIILGNASDGPVDVVVSLQDFLPNAGADSIKFVGRAEGVTSVQDWIHIDGKTSFTLGTGEILHIPFKISPPLNAEPGGHFGVVLFKATPVGLAAGSLKVGTQVGMLVLVTIPGNHLEKGSISSFTAPSFLIHGPVPFTIKFENTGTVHFEPKGDITVTNMLGSISAKIPITGHVVLPTSVRDLGFQWDSTAFNMGRYTAVATIYDGEGEVIAQKSLAFWIIPIWYIGAFLILLALVYLLLRYLKRHIRITRV